MSLFQRVAAATFAATCAITTVARAGEPEHGCVEWPRPVSLASMKDGAEAVVSAIDAGNLTIMDVQGNYARGEAALRQLVASRFYATHPDGYDFLFVFTTFEFETGNALAFYNSIRNDTAGIGQPAFDFGAAFGSPARLQGYIDMAAMSRYTFFPGSPAYRNVFDALAHEIMHRWGAEVHFVDAAGHDSSDLIGQEAAHWSYFLDSDASLMLGNDWVVQGDGTFRSVDIRHTYSKLDLYLAGFAAPSEVAPFTLIRNGTGALATDLPALGATSAGTAETITIDQVIAASGPRVPGVADSQKAFTAAMILLKRPGETVPVERLLELERFRVRAEQQMVEETDGRATLRVYTEPSGSPAVGLPEILHGSGDVATPAGIAAALAWLEQRQAIDGHWQDRPATAVRDTVAAVRAIEELDPGFASLPLARAWLASHTIANDDQRSWRLAMTHSPDDVAALVAAQVGSGGFGIRPGWSASAFDTASTAHALQAESSSANLDAALQYVGARQNADGSFGVIDGGRGRILPTLRAATLLASNDGGASAQGLQRAVAWMNDRWVADGGLGSGTQSSLSETIEAYSLLGQVPLEASVAAGMRSYVNRAQQLDGDWGGSVYLTAVAMLAYGHNERPNLAFVGTPTATPSQPNDGERATLTAVVVNSGNVPVGPSILRWYDGEPLQGGVQVGADVTVPDLAANARATVAANWDTTGFAGPHALWAVLDADASIDEASELDNRAHIDVIVSPPSALPDLALFATDIILDPPAFSTLPSAVHLTGIVRNIGLQPVAGAVVRLYAKPDLDHAIVEEVLDVPARGATPLSLDLTVTHARTLDLVLRVDPDDAIAEANEGNNAVERTLPFGPSIDLEIAPADISLVTATPLPGRMVDFDVTVRNRGTVDSPSFQLRAEVVQQGVSTPIFDASVQVPAGQGLQRRVQWPADAAGPAQLRIVVDPDDQVAELDEQNNAASLDFTVFALDQPDLTFVADSLDLVPVPGQQGQPLTAQVGVRNLGSVATGDFRVALYAADPASGAAPLGGTTIASLAGGTSATATIVVPDLPLSGDQHLFAKIDADEQIAEIDETNNVIVKALRVMPLPDLAIGVADISLNPPLPVAGEAVLARVTVHNLGGQDAHDVTVRLIEGDVDSGVAVGTDGTIPLLAAGASTTLTWNWTLGIASDARVVTAVADPLQSVRETTRSNNAASLPFDVQDGDFFANERYISPNGDGVQDAVVVVFRMPQAGATDVEVVNGAQYVVRHFTDVALNADLRGEVLWDGRDDRGRIVGDGEYRIAAIDAQGMPHGDVTVTVDNNRSSFLDAVGTPHGVDGEVSGSPANVKIPPASSPMHDELFMLWRDAITHPFGLYRTDALFTDAVPLISYLWLARFKTRHGLSDVGVGDYVFSPDGAEIAVILRASPKYWIARTSVDQINGAVEIAQFQDPFAPTIFGYFDATTLVIGPTSDHMLHVVDVPSGNVSPLRSMDDMQGCASFEVVADGIACMMWDGGIDGFLPRDPARPYVQVGPSLEWDAPLTPWVATSLSPQKKSALVHEVIEGSETIRIVHLPSGERTTLLETVPGIAHGQLSTQRILTSGYGAVWLEQQNRLLVADATRRVLYTYSEAGQLLSQTALPDLQRSGAYRLDDGQPPNLSTPDNVFPYGGTQPEHCVDIGDRLGAERQIFDPATNRYLLEFGESVPYEYQSEGDFWWLGLKAGIADQFGIDVDTGRVDTIQTGSMTPLDLPADAGAHPLREHCVDSPMPDAPVLLLGDGARLRNDGRVQSMSHGTTAEPWLTGTRRIQSIWPDESQVLFDGDHTFSSLLNLRTLLQARTFGRGIELFGVAADRNFAYYTLDWAPVEQPNNWQALTPASSDQVFLDEFLTWVPPQPGTFLIRLTVVDKAGNTASTIATSSSFESAVIDNFSMAPRYISSNGDGVQDDLVVRYRVRQPVTLGIRIADASGNPVRAVERTYGSADLGADAYRWDGRDDGGHVVADGRYRVSLGGFSAWVTVDSTPPMITGALQQPYWGDPCGASYACNVHPHDTLTFSITEANLSADPSDAGLERVVVGDDAWVRGDPRAPNGVVPAAFFNQHMFRAKARDMAGNSSQYFLGTAEEALPLERIASTKGSGGIFKYQTPPLSQTPDVTNWPPVVVDRTDGDYFVGWDYSGKLSRIAVETADAITPTQWVERRELALSEALCVLGPGCDSGARFGELHIPIDWSVIPQGSRLFVRLRGERADGSRLYSNQGYVQVGGIDPPHCVSDGISATESYEGPLVDAKLHYLFEGRELTSDADNVSDTDVHFPSIEHEVIAWVEAKDSFGHVRRSESSSIKCSLPGSGQGTTDVLITRFPVIQDQCDGQPSNRIRLAIRITANAVDPGSTPTHVRVSYVSGVTNQDVVLMDEDVAMSPLGGGLARAFDVATEGWPEGEYDAGLEVRYMDGTSRAGQTRLPVTKVAPDIAIGFPREGERICAAHADGGRQTFPFSVDVHAPVDSSYRIGIAAGAYPLGYDCKKTVGEVSPWAPHPLDLPQSEYCSPYSSVGDFALQSVDAHEGEVGGDLEPYNGLASLQMKAVDWSGGTVCTERRFFLDSDIEFFERALPQTSLPFVVAFPDPMGIAPAATSAYATAKYSLRATEPVHITASVYRAHVTGGGFLVFDGDPLATIMQADDVVGNFDVTWNGSIDGTTAADGFYGIAIDATDDCAHAKTLKYGALIDATPPNAVFASPAAGSTTTAPVIEFVGSVDDNFRMAAWSLEFALAESPDTWQTIQTGLLPVSSDVLGVWSRGSLTGAVDVRLVAFDALGNRSETHLPLVLGEPGHLIGSATVAPLMFSPNGDGRSDTTRLQLTVLQDAILDVRVNNAAHVPVATLFAGSAPAGSSAHVWNGTDASGHVVPDGTYEIVVDVRDPSGQLPAESVVLSAIVDDVLPTIEVRQPTGAFAAASTSVVLHLADLHFSGFDARLVRVADGAIVASADGAQGGDVLLTSLADFVEGAYALHVEARDGAGNIAIRDSEFELDTMPPIVTLDEPAEDALIQSALPISVKGSVDDANLASYVLSVAPEGDDTWTDLANGTQNIASGEIRSWQPNLPDGRYQLRLTATDKAGQTTTVRHMIEIDGTPPVAHISAPAEGGYLRERAEIAGTATDAHFARYRISLATTAQAESDQWSDIYVDTVPVDDGPLASLTLNLPEGDYVLRLIATDQVGLASVDQVHVRIDTQPPPSPIGLVGHLDNHNHDAVLDWTAVAADDLAGYRVYRNGTAINAALVEAPHYVDPEVPEGSQSYQVRAIDHAGNESGPSNTVVLYVDRTAPMAQLARPVAGERVRGSYEVIGTAYSNDDFKEYRLVATPLNPAGSPIVLATSTLAAQGRRLATWDTLSVADETGVRLRLEAEDTHGNIGVAEADVVVDNGPPAAPTGLVAALDGADALVHWNANTESDLLGYLLYRDNGLVNATNPNLPSDLRPFALTDVQYVDAHVPDGQHTYVLYAIDRAGNVSQASDPAALDPLDNAPPSMTIESPTDYMRFETSVTVLATSHDTDIAEVQFAVRRLGDAAWTDLGAALTSAPYRITWTPADGLAYDTYQIRALARDAGGRIDPAPPFVHVIYADLTPPDAPSELVAHADGGTVQLSWSPSHAADLAGYRVRRGGWEIADVPADAATFDDMDLDDGHYIYTVRAFDASGNESSPSNSAVADVFSVALDQPYTPTADAVIDLVGRSVRPGHIAVHVETDAGSSDVDAGSTAATGAFTLPAQPLALGGNRITVRVADAAGNVSRTADVWIDRGVVPAAPAGLAAAVDDHLVELAWNANSEIDVIGYRVFRNGEARIADGLLGELPVASTEGGWNPELAVDGDPQTYWKGYAYDIESPDDASLQLAWSDPRIVTGLDLTWLQGDEGHFDVFAWSGHVWVRVARMDAPVQDTVQALAFERPYRTTRLKLIVHGPGRGIDSYYRFRLAEVQVHERTLQGATSLAETVADGAWRYRVSAVSAFAFESALSDEAIAAVGDTQGPDAVVLDGDVAGRDATLTWTASASPDVAGYALERDGQRVASIDAAQPREYLDANLPNGAHDYVVYGVDAFGNQGPPSNTVSLTVTGSTPAVPVDLVVTAPDGGGLDLAWQAGGGEPAVLYRARRALAADGPFEVLTQTPATTYHDDAVVVGTTYYYTVEAVDALGNGSGPSAVASGTPRGDHVAPLPPVLTYPTTARSPSSTTVAATPVCGLAEAGASVSIDRDGVGMATAVATPAYASQTWAWTPYQDSVALSPSGRFLATRDNGGTIHAMSLHDAVTQYLADVEGWMPTWAAHRDVVYFGASVSGEVMRWVPGESATPAVETIVDAYTFAVDPTETTIVIAGTSIADPTPVEGVWLVDVASGAPRRIGDFAVDALWQNPSWSPDGTRFAFVDGEGQAYIVDVATATIVRSWPVDPWVPVVWSPDGLRVVYAVENAAGGDDLHTAAAADGGDDLVLASGMRTVMASAWSPAGGAIAVLFDDTLDILDPLTGASLLPMPYPNSGPDAASWWGLAWTPSGRIAAFSDTSLLLLDPPGWFCADVALVPGLNRLTARATDAVGNHGFASAPIDITFDASGRPDLVVAPGELFIVPAAGSVGQRYDALATVRNIGDADVEHAGLSATLRAPDGTETTLTAGTVSPLAAHGAASVTIPIGVLAAPGMYYLRVTVDPLQLIAESDESNNTATVAFAVSADGTPVLDLGLSRTIFAPGETVDGEIAVTNAGGSFSGYVRLDVEDADGFAVAALDDIALPTLGFGQHWRAPVAWSPDGILAGDYRLRARLHRASGELLSERVAPFALQAVRHLQLGLATDASTAAIGHDVVAHSTLTFSDGNALIDGAVLRLGVFDAVGDEIWHREQALGTLQPGYELARDDAWPTAGRSEGVYTLRLTLLSAQYSAAAESVVTLTAPAPVMAVSGSLHFDPGTTLVAGQATSLQWTVANAGTTPLAGVQARVRIIATSGQTPVAQAEETFDLGVGANHAGVSPLSSPPLALVAHAALLEARLPGDAPDQWRMLARQAFDVVDALPPEIDLRSPVNGEMTPAVARLVAAVVDRHSGVVAVDASVDGGTWQPLGAGPDGLYARGLAGLVDGAHVVAVRARDGWGNVAQTLPRAFMVDATPPAIAISGVVDGELANHDVTPEIAVTDAHLQDVAITLDNEPFVSATTVGAEGAHVLLVHATDTAGNSSLRSVRFTIDRTPPPLQIVAPADGSTVTQSAVRVDVHTEAGADLVLATGAYQAPAVADAAGDASFDAVPLVAGANTIEVVARDRAGNASAPAAITIVYDANVSTPLAGTLQPSTPVLAHGTTLGVHVSLHNPNATVLAAQHLRVAVVGATSTTLAEQAIEHDFVAHEDHVVDLAFDSTAWPLAPVSVVLDLAQDADWIRLDTQPVDVVDLTPPVLAILAPLESAVVRAPVAVRADASDLLSGIALVEARVDSGDWFALAADSGAYQGPPLDLADGDHEVSLRAHDGAANEAVAGPVHFAVDTQPPLINIAGIADGDLVAHTIAPTVDVSDAHLFTSDVRLNGSPYVSGTPIDASGDYVLDVLATDLAGNEANASVHFTLDLDAPLVVFTAPVDGAIVDVATIDVSGLSEAHALVHLSVGAFTVDIEAGDDGVFTVKEVPLQPGENTIAAHATDAAGNVGPDVQIVVTLQQALAAVQGQLGAVASPLPVGGAIVVPYAVQNTGTLPLPALPLRLELRDLDGDSVLVDDFTLDLPLAADASGKRTLAAQALAAGDYTLTLAVDLPGDAAAWLVLDSRVLTLIATPCAHDDTILRDGFDGVGVVRDGLIFCDGFDVTMSVRPAGMAGVPWLDATAWIAAASSVDVALGDHGPPPVPRARRPGPEHVLRNRDVLAHAWKREGLRTAMLARDRNTGAGVASYRETL